MPPQPQLGAPHLPPGLHQCSTQVLPHPLMGSHPLPSAKVPRPKRTVTFSEMVTVHQFTYQCGGSCPFATASKTTLTDHIEANHRWSRALHPRCPPPKAPTPTVTLPPTMTKPPNITKPRVTAPPAAVDLSPPPPQPLLLSPQGSTTCTVGVAMVAAPSSGAKRKVGPDRRPTRGPAKRPHPRAKAPPDPSPLPLHPLGLDSHGVPGSRVLAPPSPCLAAPGLRRSPRLGSCWGRGVRQGLVSCHSEVT